MASAKWEGGNCKGATAAKAMLRHSAIEKDRRAVAAKKNKDIDLGKAGDNFTLHGLSYEQACDRYDEIIERIRPTNTNKRHDAVTMQVIEIPAPEGLSEDQIVPWFRRVGKIIENDVFGSDNFIEGFIHADEVHEYTDPGTKEKVLSRVHGHFAGVPVVNGSLNNKKISSRRNIIKLNNAIEQMTRDEFGCSFNTGKKTKSVKTVETLKTDSMLEEMRQEERERLEHVKQLEQDAMSRYRMANREREQILKDARDKAARIVQEAKNEQTNIYVARFREKIRETADFSEVIKTSVRDLPRRLKHVAERGTEQFFDDVQNNTSKQVSYEF